jgi:hypothetical protein
MNQNSIPSENNIKKWSHKEISVKSELTEFIARRPEVQ